MSFLPPIYGRYGPNGSASGRSPASDFAWNFLSGSSTWNGIYATISSVNTTNDHLTLNIAGVYRIEAGVRYNPGTSWAQTELIVGGTGRSKHFASGTGISSGYASATISVAANTLMTVSFTARGSSETIYEVVNDTSNWMNIQYLGV